jgi:hypothetical protein
MRGIYAVTTPAAVALTAATAKTVLSISAPAQFGLELLGFEIGLDGATSTAVPLLWELCSHSNATAGTSTAATAQQVGGRAIAAGTTGAYNFSAEPTVLTPLDAENLAQYNGLIVRDYPRDATPDCAVSTGFAMRLTSPAAVNARITFYFAKI